MHIFIHTPSFPNYTRPQAGSDTPVCKMLGTAKGGVRLSNGQNLEVVKFKASKVGRSSCPEHVQQTEEQIVPD
jgi:hypothetical protein